HPASGFLRCREKTTESDAAIRQRPRATRRSARCGGLAHARTRGSLSASERAFIVFGGKRLLQAKRRRITMFGREKTDVLVVGAGPVGLFTALHLARHGVRVQIVDKEWRTGAHSYALALHAASLRLLDDLGLRARVLEHAYRVDTVAFYDG